MSNATFGHAQQTLTLINQQGLDCEEMNSLHSGYLSDLVRAIKLGTVPPRDDFQKFLRLLPELKVWKTIKLGLHKSPAEYKQKLEGGVFQISGPASQILSKVSVAETEIKVDLCRLSVADLGFKKSTRYDTICKRIVKLGGQIDESGEVGPALREQYLDQSRVESNIVAMKALADSDDDLLVFRLSVNDERWLGAGYGNPGTLFYSGECFVFVLPRK